MMICDMYYFIKNHPELCPVGIEAEIEVIPMAVHPFTGEWEDGVENTKDVIALELCVTRKYDPEVHGLRNPQGGNTIGCHEWELDCGGDCFEEAVHELYKQVVEKYGTYNEEEASKLMCARLAELNNIDMASFNEMMAQFDPK